jgi:hypothetical protein
MVWSVEARTRLDLPPGVQPPFDVFVNGVPQTEGVDFTRIGSNLEFPRTFMWERKLAFWRWALLFIGVWSSYRHHDTIDVVYTTNGQRLVADLKPRGAPRA